MPATSETRTYTSLFSATYDAVVSDPETSENLLRATVLLDRLWTRGNVKVQAGGVRIHGRAKFGRNPNAQWFRGSEKLNMDTFETATRYFYDWCNLTAPVVAVGDEIRMNAGSAQEVDLVAERVSVTFETMAQIVDVEMAGDGSSNGGKGILGLNAFAPTDPTTDPPLGALGDIAAATNTWWRNSATTSFGSMAANGPGGSAADNFMSLYNTVSDGDMVQPDLIISAQDVIEFYSRINLLAAQLAMTETASKDANRSFRSFSYKNADWTWSRNIPSGRFYMINTGDLQFWVHPMANMALSDWVDAYDADVRGAHALLTCCFLATRRLFLAVGDGVTA